MLVSRRAWCCSNGDAAWQPVTHKIRLVQPRVHARNTPQDLTRHQRRVRNFTEITRDLPQFLRCGHPLQLVEARQTDGPRMPAQGVLPGVIEVVLEVTHR